jgi:flagellar hook-basal body complex protein FliE
VSGISPLSSGYSALTSGLAGLGGLSGGDTTATATSAAGGVSGTAATTAAGSLAGALGVGATSGAGLDGLTGTGSAGATGLAGATGSGSGGFAQTLASSLEQVQALQSRSSDLAVQAATGDLEDVHDYTIAAAQAEMATEVTVALRNKAIDAFNEIMRMQV